MFTVTEIIWHGHRKVGEREVVKLETPEAVKRFFYDNNVSHTPMSFLPIPEKENTNA